MGTVHFSGFVKFMGTFLVLLVTSCLADELDILFHLVGLTGHGSLVGAQLSSLEDNAVDRVSHTKLHVDDVADMEEVVVNLDDFAVTEDAALH